MGVIIYGPQACGKTRNAQAIARHFGLEVIIDDYWNGAPLPGNALALTSDPDVAGALDFSKVMELINPL